MKSLKYVAVSAVSAGVTFFLTRKQLSRSPDKPNISITKKREKPETKSDIRVEKEKETPHGSIAALLDKERKVVKENSLKQTAETKHEPMKIDRSMFPSEFGSKKMQNNQRKSRSRSDGRRWKTGDDPQHDSSWDHSQKKKYYNIELAGKSTTDLRIHHRNKFLELVVKLPIEYQEKYAVNDWEVPSEAKERIVLKEKEIDASTFGESLTFLEYSLGKLAKAHQFLAGLDEPIAPPLQEELKETSDLTPSQLFNSILEKTHNASNMLEQTCMDIRDAEEIIAINEQKEMWAVPSGESHLTIEQVSSLVATTEEASEAVVKDASLEEISKLDNEVTKHYLAYLNYSRQIILDWHQRNRKLRPKPEALKIRLKEMTMAEQKEWLKIPPPDPSIPLKFWYQRLRLFSKYEEGIQLDTEGWFSTTPELIAKMIARRMGKGVVLDAMCGAGGNTIQMALHGASVIALDLNRERLEMCRHNARIYGVEDKITFICGDVFEKMAQMKAENTKVDAIFLAPPWGGQFYEQTSFDIRTMPVDGMKLFKKAEELCGNIAMYLPRNVDTNQVKNISESGCEIAKNRLFGKVKSVTCYYGDLNLFRKK